MKRFVPGFLLAVCLATAGYCQDSAHGRGSSVPVVTSLVPSSGPVGTKVVASGSGFTKDNVVTIRSAQGEHATLSGLKSDDGVTLAFVIPGEIDLPYPMVQGPNGEAIDIPPFHGPTKPGSYEVIVDNRVGERTSLPVVFEVTQK
ncbi:MAG: IPT/TIG domain-containing protein [Candidatus Omnitrophica bacterium]|nr:IPT/TIG domain-containing protein [Candidatus Omnitrophota bacterium]